MTSSLIEVSKQADCVGQAGSWLAQKCVVVAAFPRVLPFPSARRPGLTLRKYVGH